VLALVVCFEFLALKIEIGLLDIRLRVDRHVLAGGHGHRSSYQPGHSCDNDVAMIRMRCRHAQHQARGREDPVVRAQYRRAQPATAFRAVYFLLAYRHG